MHGRHGLTAPLTPSSRVPGTTDPTLFLSSSHLNSPSEEPEISEHSWPVQAGPPEIAMVHGSENYLSTEIRVPTALQDLPGKS